MAEGAVGEYQLQAAIAAVHDRAATADDTDWPQILALYGLLDAMTGNPVVTLNRAVAAAMAEGPAAGLALLDDGRRAARRATTASTPSGRTCWSWRRPEGAREHYRAAAARTASLPERRYLTLQAARLNAGSPPG